MSDHGEKIVSLAHDLLRSGRLDLPAPSNPKETSLALKAACLAALLSALGGAGIGHVMHENNRPATRYERVEIDALIFYAARELGLTPDRIEKEVGKVTGVGETADYTVNDYRRARTYLWLRLKTAEK